MDIDEIPNHSLGSELQMSNFAIAEQLSNGELELKEINKKSKVWTVFCKLIKKNGEEIMNFVCCKCCKKILKYNNRSTSNLTKHKCYVLKNKNETKIEIDAATKKKVTKIMTKWVIRSCRPFNLVKDEGLHEILVQFSEIGAKQGPNIDVEKALPHPTTIARNIEDLYSQNFKKIKDEVLSIQGNGYGLTTDIWTDDFLKNNYLSLTIHFVKNGTLTVRLLGLVSMRGERCTSENIYQKVRNLLNDFGCDFCFKSIIVTDRGANMMKAFQSTQHLACISHLLHNTVSKSIEQISELSDLIYWSAKLVKFFKKSGLNARLPISLKSFCVTRWNTTFYMLRSIETNWGEINQLLLERNELNRIASININNIQIVTKILQPFEETSKVLEGEDYSTMHLVLIHLHKLKNLCAPTNISSDLTKKLKEKLLSYLNSLVIPNIKIFHKIAVFLYPPFNKLIQFSEGEKKSIYDECLRLLQFFQNEQPTLQEVLDSSPQNTEEKELFLDFLPEETNNNPERDLNHEIQLYKNTNVAYSDNFNVFNWWELQKNQFPYLFKLSCMILSTPASSASSERIFSSARHLLCEKRSAICSNEDSINQIMFLHTNLEKGDIFYNESSRSDPN